MSMVGSFGLNGCHLRRVPRDRFVEANPRIDAELRWGEHGGYRLARRTPNLLVDGNSVSVVWTDWALPWFECPRCGRRCRHVYLLNPIACRRCHGLDYAGRHLGQQTPAAGRVERLRRKLGGCDTRPFAPLPPRPPGRSKAYHEKMVAMIQAEERSLVEHLGTIVHDLRRRIRVRKAKRKW